ERLVRQGLVALGLFSPANLMDVVQDVFLKAFSETARKSYDGTRPFGPFLTVIARNVLIDWARRSSREIADNAAIEAALSKAEDPGADDGSAVFAPALLALTQRYIDGLPAEFRAVHLRRFVMAEPQRGAAAALGISRQTLRTIERKLIEGLRAEI